MAAVMRILVVLCVIAAITLVVRLPLERAFGPSMWVSLVSMVAALALCFVIDRQTARKAAAASESDTPPASPWLDAHPRRVLSRLVWIPLVAVCVVGLRLYVATTPQQAQAESAAMQRLGAQRDLLRQHALETVDTDADALSTFRANLLHAVREASGGASPAEHSLLEVVARLAAEGREEGAEYDAAVAHAAEWIRVDNLQSRDQIAIRLAEIERFEKAIDAVRSMTLDMPTRLADILALADIPAEESEAFVTGFNESYQLELRMQMLQHDEMFCMGARTLLALLDREWGSWRVADDSGLVMFDQPSAAERFNTLVGLFEELHRRSEAAGKRFLAGDVPP